MKKRPVTSKNPIPPYRSSLATKAHYLKKPLYNEDIDYEIELLNNLLNSEIKNGPKNHNQNETMSDIYSVLLKDDFKTRNERKILRKYNLMNDLEEDLNKTTNV